VQAHTSSTTCGSNVIGIRYSYAENSMLSLCFKSLDNSLTYLQKHAKSTA